MRWAVWQLGRCGARRGLAVPKAVVALGGVVRVGMGCVVCQTAWHEERRCLQWLMADGWRLMEMAYDWWMMVGG